MPSPTLRAIFGSRLGPNTATSTTSTISNSHGPIVSIRARPFNRPRHGNPVPTYARNVGAAPARHGRRPARSIGLPTVLRRRWGRTGSRAAARRREGAMGRRRAEPGGDTRSPPYPPEPARAALVVGHGPPASAGRAFPRTRADRQDSAGSVLRAPPTRHPHIGVFAPGRNAHRALVRAWRAATAGNTRRHVRNTTSTRPTSRHPPATTAPRNTPADSRGTPLSSPSENSDPFDRRDTLSGLRPLSTRRERPRLRRRGRDPAPVRGPAVVAASRRIPRRSPAASRALRGPADRPPAAP